MGKRDIRSREVRKPKKESRKVTTTDILPSPVTVEIIKKVRKEHPAEE